MIIYQIYPRSFKDTNGDGIGDLQGIVEKLPYIADLGADAIWISPFFTSPMRDFGYDISDYRGVDPMFGTLQDFENLVRTAHQRNLKVIIDQVWGHCSDQHVWFQQSRQSRTNEKTDWFIWADPRQDGFYPNNWISIFGGPAWTWNPARGQYYLHHFHTSQPVLNLRNDAVFKGIVEDALFWVDMGIEGFRIDALPHFLADPALRDNPPLEEGMTNASFTVKSNPRNFQHNIYTECIDDLFPLIEKFRAAFDATGKNVFMVGECMTGTTEYVAQCCKSDHRMQSVYMDKLISAELSASAIRKVIRDVQKNFDDPAKMTWSVGNHDVVRMYGRLLKAQGNTEGLWRLIVALYFCLEGNLFWYQGDELGLEEADIPYELIQDPFGKVFWPEFKGRDGARTPMPWYANEKNAGFSEADKTWLPIPIPHKEKSVDAQMADPVSKLNTIKNWMATRRGNPVLTQGKLTLEKGLDDFLVAFTREYEGKKILCVFNFNADGPVHVDRTIGTVIAQDKAEIAIGVTLQPHGYIVAEIV